MSKALAKTEEPGIPARNPKAELEALIAEVDREAAQVMACAPLAAELDDDTETKPEGWTNRQFRVAKDFRKSTADAPFYLKACQAQVAAARPQETKHTVHLNIQRPQVILPPKYEDHEVIDVEVVEVEEDRRE